MISAAPQFSKISGYTITEQIYRGSRTGVYRAIREAQKLPVIIKVLQREYPTFGELVQFRNQYAIAKNLPITGIIQPLSLEPFGNSYALIMADWGGISLETYIQEQPLDIADILAIAIQLAEILHELQQHRIIHKDIKPANILIHPESKQVKLIDFSIASLLPKETQEIQNPSTLEGTLAYLAPEQTGRMNRGIDYRSDFYALGVTLYQLLTGRLPFLTHDPLELVHCHIAKIATPAHEVNTGIPSILGAIVAKLMDKNAEDRYQSALGLKYDLELCCSQWKQTGLIAEFELGQRDLCDRFIIPEKLYGRETEVEVLLDAFERVAAGTTELMLVAGFSGIGKTAVINEVHKPIVRQRGYFIKGKFDQFNRNIPLSAFVQALRDLMEQLLSESDSQLAQWKAQILEALGDNGQVLIDVIPELEQIIGKQAIAPELSETAAQNRFNLLFQKFIAVFTTAEHPLVIFLDDLQWADLASLQLMKLLMNDNGYLLMLGAYRDNEVSSVHPFMLTIEELKKVGAIVHTIILKPLAFEDTNRLIADTLNCSTELAQPLTELIDRKTQGNPFFTTQFLRALHEDGHIIFNGDRRYWQCDMAQINTLALNDDVVEFMALQLQKLPQESQQALKLAACVGNQFDLETLAIISEQLLTDTATALWKALQEGLILPTSQVYKFFQNNDQPDAESSANSTYRFLHDRVQQAAYSLITAAEKQATHLMVGRLMKDKMSVEKREEKLFQIVNQLNIGAILISNPIECEELVHLNLLAGKKAKESVAYIAAAEYFRSGIKLLAPNCWREQYLLTFNLHQKLAEVEFMNGNFEEVDKITEVALSQIESTLDQAKLYNLLILRYTFSADYRKAIQIGRTALSLLGEQLPETDLKAALNLEYEMVRQNLGQREIASLIDAPNIDIPEKEIAIELLKNIDPPAYFTDTELYSVIVVRSVNLSLQYGNAPQSPKGYSTYGLLSGSLFGNYQDGFEFGQLSLKLSEKLNPSQKSQAYAIAGGWLNHWVNHLKDSDATLNAGYQAGLECGDFQFAGYSLIFKALHQLHLGVHLEKLLDEIKPLLQFAQKTRNQWAIDAMIACEILCSNLCGRTENLLHFANDDMDEETYLNISESNGSLSWIGTYLTIKSKILYLYGYFQAALETVQRAEKYLPFMLGHFSVVEYNFSNSLNLIACYQQLLSSEHEPLCLKTLHGNQTQLKKWVDVCPENFLHKYELIQAEIAQLVGNRTQAIDLYDRAIAAAKANGYIQEEALANELAAKFYLNWGKEKVAAGYMQEAYYCYAKWGAKAKVVDLKTRYPDLLRPILQQAEASMTILSTLATISAYSVSGYTSNRNSSSSANINQSLDFAAILKASQALSSTIQFDQLLHQLTQIILQNSGADRCALMLPSHDGEWQVRAMSDDKPQSVYATPNETQLCAEPLTNHPHVPVRLIQYVKNTKEVVVIDNMETTLPVIGDYLRQHQPKSVLCMPLLHQGHLIGILYLNNQLTCGVFTADRILILNFLCTQAAISLENARLYQQLEHSLQDAQQKSEDLAEVLALSNGQQQILALIAQGVSLNTILAETARSIESHTNHPAYCSFLLIDTEGRLRYAAAPSLPAAYNALIDGVKIGPEVGSCGTAAYCKASVTVTDIATDPLWANYQFALDFGLRACASTPILGAEGEVLATLAMYLPVAGEFTLHDRKLMEVATYLAHIAIERHQADVELQNTQLQVLQSEKMASLGNLVAGVAHEINNPIGFLNGSINNSKEYVQDLLGHLALYQQHYPNPVELIQDNAEDIDLEFLSEDLPKLLDSMKGATNRIRNISNSLRTFSRADTEYKIRANLHEGLDSTLLILKYRLKANEHRPAIQVIQDFGDLPPIECFPGQLNQVFMNILANAIDMFDEMAQTQSFKELEAHPQQITIRTEVISNQVYIRIRDNGKGMTQEVQQKIFDHLFTTKAVGKGTGLGLAIARQIVVEKHGGSLNVWSELGQGTEFTVQIPVL